MLRFISASKSRGFRGLPLVERTTSTLLFFSAHQLHTPPGGFEEPLPPSFGRHSGKGEISNVNLRKKKVEAKNRRQRKKKLLIPQENTKITLETVREELQLLVKRNAIYSQKGHTGDTIIDRSAEVPTGGPDRPKANFMLEASSTTEENADAGLEPRGAVASSPATLLGGMEEEEGLRSQRESQHQALSLTTPRGDEREDAWDTERRLERYYAVNPGSTIFGSDLDRLEEDMRREFMQSGSRLPKLDAVYAEFGAGERGRRMRWEPSSSFDYMKGAGVQDNVRSEHHVGMNDNRNLSAYHMSAEAYREQQETAARHAKTGATAAKGINFKKANLSDDCAEEQNSVENADERAAEENPHFPSGTTDAFSGSSAREGDGVPLPEERSLSEDRHMVIDARRDYKSRLNLIADENEGDDSLRYDAYNQRPAEQRKLELRGADYWEQYENRAKVEEHEGHRLAKFREEVLREGAVDTSEMDYSVNRVRKETFLYFQAHPINEMIQESFVRIREILPKSGEAALRFNPTEPQTAEGTVDPSMQKAVDLLNMNVDIPVQEARRMAQNLGLDLIRVGSLHSQKSDRRIIALCMIADHREHLREMVRFKIQKLGVQPPPTKECIEVPFTGSTHPHGIRFKSVGIAKHLLHRHAIRINLTKFGTPREGFPVLQTILDEVKRQCIQLKAYHTIGEIQANYNEIYCYVYPSTGKSPKTSVKHPSPAEVRAAQEFYTLQNEKEVYFDDLHDKVTQKERLRYMLKMDKGTAWAEKDDGLSLQRQRSMKVMLGYLPKGNKDIYAARGDVNVPAPFRASHLTSTERWSHPMESNLEQASRGAAALGRRAAMPISEMHDLGETPENPSRLDRFYYKVQGPALEVGEFKEALGLKDNRRKRPPLAPGFATLGMQEGASGGQEHGFAPK